MKVGLNNNFLIQGCEIINYLLEKSRVVTQSTMERNYHIFYQLIAGADSATKKRLHLRPPSEYNYLNQSGCSVIDGVNDADEFREVLQAMNTLQFSSSTVESMLKAIAGILLLGNITFDQGNDSESSKISPKSLEILTHCADLLGVNVDMFAYSLTEKKVQMGRGSIISITLSVAQAEENRDTVAKTLYSNMFDWTIVKVNSTLKSPTEAPYSIGILDIFGFEVFELNSFEQLCINYANEKLQYHFNEVIFNEETLMYKSEGVPTEEVVFEDNADCVKLIEGKPYGLLSLLEEECSLGEYAWNNIFALSSGLLTVLDPPFSGRVFNFFCTVLHSFSFVCRLQTWTFTSLFLFTHFPTRISFSGNATDLSYIAKIDKTFGTGKAGANKFFVKNKTKPECFSVCHFAGAVEYNVANFLDKNRDTLSITAREVMESSAIPLIAELFAQPAGAADKKGTKSTLGGQFRNQLIGLLSTLYTTEPHFIRCVKPNHEKVGGKFDGQLALRQLRYAGLFEAIRIRKSGFAYRATFRVFANSYQILVDGMTKKREKKAISDQECCKLILQEVTAAKQMESNAWFVGNTKVFLKTNAHRTVLERQKVSRVEVYALRIQLHLKAFVARMIANRAKYALLKEQARIAAEKDVKTKAVLVIQKHIRRKLVSIMMKSMHNLIELRKVLARKEISKVKLCLEKIDSQHKSASSAALTAMFQHEVKIARVMVRLLEIQAKLIEELTQALETSDSAELNRLIMKSERLEMSNHPLVVIAKDLLMRLHAKRQIMNNMVAFLKNEDEFTETILSTLQAANEYDIDPEFIEKVRSVYDKAGPRLKTRNRLRHMVESVDRHGIEQTCLEVLRIQQMQPGFAESELRAAKAMLRLLNFDAELNPIESDDTTQDGVHCHSDDCSQEGDSRNVSFEAPATVPEEQMLWGRKVTPHPTYPKLGREVREVCYAILTARNPAQLNTEKRRLLEMSGSVERLYDIIRYYKWSNTLCTWKYPEVLLAQEQLKAKHAVSIGSPGSPTSPSRPALNTKVHTQETEFYGLRPAEARASAYIIRTLHKDFDPLTGSSSALMQAALGSVDVPTSVAETLSHLELMSDIDGKPMLPNGKVFTKTHLKHPRTLQLSSPSAGTSGGTTTGSGSKTATSGKKTATTAAPSPPSLSIRSTMVAPRSRVSVEILNIILSMSALCVSGLGAEQFWCTKRYIIAYMNCSWRVCTCHYNLVPILFLIAGEGEGPHCVREYQAARCDRETASFRQVCMSKYWLVMFTYCSLVHTCKQWCHVYNELHRCACNTTIGCPSLEWFVTFLVD